MVQTPRFPGPFEPNLSKPFCEFQQSNVGAWTQDGPVKEGNKFYNNTAIGETISSPIGQGHIAEFAKIEVRNNIFYPTTRISLGLAASYPTITNNIFFNVSGALPPGNRLEDPQLVNHRGSTPESAKLRASSRAINAALGTVPNTDFFQGMRPVGGVADIGAHEYRTADLHPKSPASLRVR